MSGMMPGCRPGRTNERREGKDLGTWVGHERLGYGQGENRESEKGLWSKKSARRRDLIPSFRWKIAQANVFARESAGCI